MDQELFLKRWYIIFGHKISHIVLESSLQFSQQLANNLSRHPD